MTRTQTRISPEAVEPQATAANPAILEVAEDPDSSGHARILWHSTEMGVPCVRTVADLHLSPRSDGVPRWVATMRDFQRGVVIEAADRTQVVAVIGLAMAGAFPGAVRMMGSG